MLDRLTPYIADYSAGDLTLAFARMTDDELASVAPVRPSADAELPDDPLSVFILPEGEHVSTSYPNSDKLCVRCDGLSAEQVSAFLDQLEPNGYSAYESFSDRNTGYMLAASANGYNLNVTYSFPSEAEDYEYGHLYIQFTLTAGE